MKLLTKIIPVILCCVFLLMVTGCKKDPVFGNDRAVSGIMKDQKGNVVAGDITTTDFIVKALGAGDVVTTDMRVMGDGTFQNTKLYAKKYKIWVTGPVTTTEDTLTVDLAANPTVAHNFVVIPFVTIDLPVAGESPTATTIDIHYGMAVQSGKTISKRELYCSTNPYPNAIIGTGAFYTTTKVVLTTDSGTATVTGLVTNTQYYIRIGTQTTGSPGFNYSEQITVKTL